MAGRETPATRVLRACGVAYTLHEYRHDPGAESYAIEAVTALALEASRVFKTLVVELGATFAVCVVPAADQLDLHGLGKGATLAPAERAERITGYVAGGISPLGQRRRLRTLIDASALDHETVFVSAGRRGLEIELAAADLVRLTAAEVRALRRS